MAQIPPLDPARDWLLEQIQDPATIDAMSENELDQALALLGIDVSPLLATLHDKLGTGDDQRPDLASTADNGDRQPADKEAAIFRLLDQIEESNIDGMTEAELDDALATLAIDVAPILGSIPNTLLGLAFHPEGRTVKGEQSGALRHSHSSPLRDKEEVGPHASQTPMSQIGLVSLTAQLSALDDVRREKVSEDCVHPTPDLLTALETPWVPTPLWDMLALSKPARKSIVTWPLGFSFDVGIELVQCKISLHQTTNAAEAYHNLGWAHAQIGRFSEAIAAYRKAIDLELRCANAHHDLGWAHVRIGQLPESIAAYRTAIMVKPYHLDAFHNVDRGSFLWQSLEIGKKPIPRMPGVEHNLERRLTSVVSRVLCADKEHFHSSLTKPATHELRRLQDVFVVRHGLRDKELHVSSVAERPGFTSARDVYAVLVWDVASGATIRPPSERGGQLLDALIGGVTVNQNDGLTILVEPKSSTDMTKTAVARRLKTMMRSKDFVAFGRANLEVLMRSGQIWGAGAHDPTKRFTCSAKASFDDSVFTFTKAAATATSVKELVELQSSCTAKFSFDESVSTFKATSAARPVKGALKLTEQKPALTNSYWTLTPSTSPTSIDAPLAGSFPWMGRNWHS